MPYKEILLTKQLLSRRIGKLKQYHSELYIRQKPYRSKSYMESLNKSIDNNTIYCGICDQPIDAEYFGKTIITNKNNTSYTKKWYHVMCAIKKNLITLTENNNENVQN